MDNNLSFRILSAIGYICVTVFLITSISSCCRYSLQSEKQYIDGGFTKKTLLGSEDVSWVRK